MTSRLLRYEAKCVQRRCFQCGSVPLRSYIKGTELPPANILRLLERQLIALQLCPESFWATVCKTVRPMLSDRCPVCPVCLSDCDVAVLWPNGLTDQDETWHAGRPRPWPHCVRWGPSSPSPKGAQPPIFGPYPLRPNGCIDQDATLYGTRPPPRRFYV